MKAKNLRKALLLCLIIALSIGVFPVTAMANSPNIDKTVVDFKTEILRLANEEREKLGLEPLLPMEELDKLADIRAQEIKVLFSHTRPGGKKWFSVFANTDLKYRKAGENLAFGFKKPADLVNAWMKSKSHKANILNPDFEYLGVGYYKDARGRIHASQLFYKPIEVKEGLLPASK